MAFIRPRNKTFSVIYKVPDQNGKIHQRSEGYGTRKEAEKRRKEVDYKESQGIFIAPKCTKVKEFLEEYVKLYGHNA